MGSGLISRGKRVKKLYWFYKNQGVCPVCRINPAKKDRCKCRKCLDRHNEISKKRRRTNLK